MRCIQAFAAHVVCLKIRTSIAPRSGKDETFLTLRGKVFPLRHPRSRSTSSHGNARDVTVVLSEGIHEKIISTWLIVLQLAACVKPSSTSDTPELGLDSGQERELRYVPVTDQHAALMLSDNAEEVAISGTNELQSFTTAVPRFVHLAIERDAKSDEDFSATATSEWQQYSGGVPQPPVARTHCRSRQRE